MATGKSGILLNDRLIDFQNAADVLPYNIRNGIASLMLPQVNVRHAEPSMLFSLDDEPWKPSQRLYDLAAQIASEVPKTTHPMLAKRKNSNPRWYEEFPGDHYHMLSVLTRILDAKVVWEFGTDLGMSTIAMCEGLRHDGKIYTVDIDSWTTKTDPWLAAEDFASGRVTQIVSDMKAPDLFAKWGASIADADFIFVDGPKDITTETAFIQQLDQIPFQTKPIVMFDDIRLTNMLNIWRNMHRPKIDMTSFGHWSGTGLIDWS